MSRPQINSGFWADRQSVNAQKAIFHQWIQLESSGCIENFRLAAGEVEGWREGWFFADSDAYKWLEAAARIWGQHHDPRLAALMDGFIALIGLAQAADGYIFTYNQIHFPNVRWQNLQVEHEMYCHGHLIEAGVSHFQATGRTDLLTIARKAADRIAADFSGQGPEFTPGHEEIEIALLRLHEVTPGDSVYLETARQFIERRGRVQNFALSIIRQVRQVDARGKVVDERKKAYLAAHPDFTPYVVPEGNTSKKPRGVLLRYAASALSGKYFQQHTPVRSQTVPVGHSVRFAYLETATAKLARLTGDRTLIPALEQAWECMVARRMYVTGGIGSLPGLEGFGRDYELNDEFAYAETCAALGSIFWNREMAGLTGDPKYSELAEWQLYNAAAVGMGLDGTTYLYNNPLACHGGVTRKPWYSIPCCPSNLSRTWASLGDYVFSVSPGELQVQQYFGSRWTDAVIPFATGRAVHVSLELESALPWQGLVRLRLAEMQSAQPFGITFCQPGWADGMHISINGEPEVNFPAVVNERLDPTASGYDPRRAKFRTLQHTWHSGDEITVHFEMPIRLLRAHPKVKGHKDKVAVTRGPLVYCLESTDNPGVDLFTARLDPASLGPLMDPNLLGGIVKLTGRTLEGAPLTFIPYFLWGNRGPSQMTVWVVA